MIVCIPPALYAVTRNHSYIYLLLAYQSVDLSLRGAMCGCGCIFVWRKR